MVKLPIFFLSSDFLYFLFISEESAYILPVPDVANQCLCLSYMGKNLKLSLRQCGFILYVLFLFSDTPINPYYKVLFPAVKVNEKLTRTAMAMFTGLSASLTHKAILLPSED